MALHKGEPFRYIAALLAFGAPSIDGRHSWMRTVPTAMFECTQAIPSSSFGKPAIGAVSFPEQYQGYRY